MINMDETKTSLDVVETLRKASEGLQFMSESEYPFAVFLWSGQTKVPLITEIVQQTGHNQGTPTEIVELNEFFQPATQEPDWYSSAEKATAQKYQNLVKTIESNLSDIKVYRIGEAEIDVYIVGKANSNDLAGLSTKVIET